MPIDTLCVTGWPIHKRRLWYGLAVAFDFLVALHAVA